jgi:Tfp pilus assembly protein PilE
MTVRNGRELNKGYRKLRSDRGMTMAEMLATVAILMILMGVIFVGLIHYQKLMAQAERDGYAKQIFIAAQNHLTMARGEGYLGVADKDVLKNKTDDEKAEILGNASSSGKRYFVVNKGDAFTGDGGDQTTSIIDQMLPFGAVDETIRLGGSYIIEYDPDTATVYNVFYCSTGSGKFDYELTDTEYDSTTGFSGYVDEYNEDGSIKTNRKAKRRNDFHDGKILGWYGGADLDALEVPLKAPTVTVENGAVLKVTIQDNNALTGDAATYGEIKLFITGKTNNARRAIHIKANSANTSGVNSIATDSRTGGRLDNSKGINNGQYVYILDDITSSDNHFAKLKGDSIGNLIAGDDIEVRAVSYSSQKLANIAYSDPAETNSLYESSAKPKDIDSNTSYDDNDIYAYISNIRHLENLDPAVSKTGYEIKKSATGEFAIEGDKKIDTVRAYQTDNLNWSYFKELTKGARTTVYDYTGTSAGGYYPVSPGYSLIYDGLRHSVSDITVDVKGSEAGMFGTFGIVADTSASAIRNLKLTDFDIEGNSTAGALAGVIRNTNVNNVIAYNKEKPNGYLDTATVNAGAGIAGGLIGAMKSGSSVKYSGAALVVSGGTNAGGLIGDIADGGSVRACYSGGHTDEGTYYKDGDTDKPSKALYNVKATGSGKAGGLIGDAGSAAISNSYSTCSVQTDTNGKAGGLVGSSNGTITNCYCTGLVSGMGDNAFIGNTGSNINISGSKYLEIINEVKSTNGYTYKGSGASDTAVTAIDDDADSYESYVSGRSKWNRSYPYDTTLRKYYHDASGRYLYNFKTVTQLEQTDDKTSINSSKLNKKSSLFVNSHYGDWPAPETFIINGSSSSGSDGDMWGTVTGVEGLVASDKTIEFTYKGIRFTGKKAYDWSNASSPVKTVVEPNTLAYYNGQLRFFRYQKNVNGVDVTALFSDTGTVIFIPDNLEVMDRTTFDALSGHKIDTPESMNTKTIIYVDPENRQIFLRTADTALTYPSTSMNGWTDVTDRFPNVDWANVPLPSGGGQDDQIVYNEHGYYLQQTAAWDGHKSYALSLKNITGSQKESLSVKLTASGNITTIGGNVSGTINGDGTITVTFNNWGNPIQVDAEFQKIYMVIQGTGDFSVQ